MTDNFENFKNFMINFHGKNLFDGGNYFSIELVRRGKDNKDLPAANKKLVTYFIDSWKKYERVTTEIKDICNAIKYRAYASVNMKNYEQVTKNTCAEFARRIASGDYKKSYAIWDSCSGKQRNKDGKCFVVDIDETVPDCDTVNSYINLINNEIRPLSDKHKVIEKIPTRTGVHLLCKPFDVIGLQKKCIFRDVDIPDVKRNHLTLLYENL